MGDGVETELARVANLESARRRTPRLESAPGSLPGMLIGIIHAIEKNALTTRASRQRLESWKLGNWKLRTLERPNALADAPVRERDRPRRSCARAERHQGRCVHIVKHVTGLSDGPSG